MRNFIKDLRFALRTMVKNPGFAVIAIVTLALGMAVNTTVLVSSMDFCYGRSLCRIPSKLRSLR